MKEHGAVPFWFWNGDQQPEELSRQLELARDGGFRGLAIHARVGNRTEYMSDRWVELTRHCCEEALRLDLDIWLYDEEGFPSGSVGGRLQKDRPSLQHKQLKYGYLQGGQLDACESLFAAYDAATFERVDSGDVAPDREVLAFWVVHVPRFVDMLKRETVERFMDMTHRKYQQALTAYIGKPITHIYTDDLYSYHGFTDGLPYTEELQDLFASRLGVDLFDVLPALVENLPGSAKARFGFRKLILDLFLQEFVAPMYKWCDAHGLRLTGHLCGDEGTIEKAVGRFGAAMPFYEYEHTPGVDDFLCTVPDGCYLDALRNQEDHCPVIVFKQASSVGNQLKGGRCGSECLTFLGWGAPVWGQSATLNYELALGVNLFTHHALSYATGGVAKRDCPPSYFFQQPYWPSYRLLNEAVARSTALLKRGTYDASVLVIHPATSAWVAMGGDIFHRDDGFMPRQRSSFPQPHALEDCLAAVSHELLRLRVGFEYGCEEILAGHGSVDGARLRLGDMAYATVVIPEVCNLMGTTVELLRRFQKAGGRLIAVNPSRDCLVDGELPEASVFGQVLNPETIRSPEILRNCSLAPSCDLKVEEAHAPVVCHTRVVNGLREHFVFNVSSRPQPIAWGGNLHAYDPLGHACIVSDLPSLVLLPFHAIHLLPEKPDGAAVHPLAETIFQPPVPGESEEIQASRWRIELGEANLMLIDWCELADGRTVHAYPSGVDGAAVWQCRVLLEIPEPARVVSLVGEAETLCSIRINGIPLPAERTAHPASQDMLVASVAGLFCVGENVITFSGKEGRFIFEPFYLMGMFGVSLGESIAGMRPTLGRPRPTFGDLVECGLPFYWGAVHYETQIEVNSDVEWLDCGHVAGVVYLEVNGETVGCRYAAPYRFRIAGAIRGQTNTIRLTLYNTAQNLFGPHRRSGRDALSACRRRGKGGGEFYLAPFGIHGPVCLETGSSTPRHDQEN